MRKIYQSSPFNAKKMFSGKYKHIFQISAVRTGVCTYVRMNATLLEIKILVNVISLGLWLG